MLGLDNGLAVACAVLLAGGSTPGCFAAAEPPAAASPATLVTTAPPGAASTPTDAGVPGILLTPQEPHFFKVLDALRRAIPVHDGQLPGSPCPERIALDDNATVRLAIVFHDEPSRRRQAEALNAALPLAVHCLLLPGSNSSPETDSVSIVARAAGLDDEGRGLAVVLLSRNDAAAWVATSTGDPSRFASASLAMIAVATGLSPSLPATRAADSPAPAALDDSVTLTAIPSGSTSTLRKIIAATDQPVLLTFWADWCKPCLNEMPELQRLHAKYGDRIRFVGLAHGRAQNPNLAKVLRDKGVTFQNHAFIEQALYTSVFATEMELPGLVVLDRSTKVVQVVHGAITEPAAMEALVARLESLAPSSRKTVIQEEVKP